MPTRGSDVATVLSAAGGTTLETLGLVTTGAASGLPTAVATLLGFSAASSAVPIIGWIIAGLAGATAGSIALVSAIRAGKRRKADAAKEAAGLGLVDSDGIPGYVVKALKKGKAWRADEMAHLIEKIKRNPDRNGHARKKDVERLRFLAIVDAHESAAEDGRIPPAAPIAEIEAAIPAESDSVPGWVYAAGMAGGLWAIYRWVL